LFFGTHRIKCRQANNLHVLYGFSSALGYSLVIILFAGLRQRLEKSVLPDLFHGTPISFITAGILAMAFAGFGGLAG
jgi:electron transport complex protein RnfA